MCNSGPNYTKEVQTQVLPILHFKINPEFLALVVPKIRPPLGGNKLPKHLKFRSIGKIYLRIGKSQLPVGKFEDCQSENLNWYSRLLFIHTSTAIALPPLFRPIFSTHLFDHFFDHFLDHIFWLLLYPLFYWVTETVEEVEKRNWAKKSTK